MSPRRTWRVESVILGLVVDHRGTHATEFVHHREERNPGHLGGLTSLGLRRREHPLTALEEPR
jgi:hypothetical protein